MLKRTDPIDLVRAHMEALRRLGAAEDSPELMGHVEALEGALNAAQIGRHSQSTAPVEVHAVAPKYLDLFEQHPLATFLVDEAGQILLANLAATTLCGALREDLLGESLVRMATEETGPTLLRHVQRVVVTGFERGCEMQLRRADASVCDLVLEMAPYPSEPGRVIVSATDVTGRKRIERALRESADRYRSIFEDARDGVVVLSENWQLVDANASACRLFGVPLRELTRRTLWSFFPGDRVAEQRAALMQEATSPCPALVDVIVLRKHDERVRLEVSIGAGVGPRGRVYELCLRDVTTRQGPAEERERLLDRLQKSQRLESLGRLSGGVAHDLGNVLTAINGLASAVLIDLPPESPLREDVAALLEANHRGSDIARQLLAFAGQEDNHPRAWPLASILRDVVGLASRGAHHVSFELDLEEGLLVDGERDQLAHVFLNLVLNALDALGAGGTVRVEARAVAPGGVAGARVRVIDDGAGMDAATRMRALEPFFSTKPHAAGTGLGLAVVHRFVQARGGVLELESTPERGTVVTVELPASGRPAEAPKRVEPAALDGLRALVIDDEPLVLAAFRRMLKGLGVASDIAVSGREGIAAFERDPDGYDVVILDLHMQELDGPAVLTHVLGRRAEQRVLFTSGDVRERVPDSFRRLDNVGFLRKPFLQKDLASHVTALVRGPSLFGA